MPASAPLMVSDSVTVLAVPTFLVSNTPVALTVTTSPAIMPPLCSALLVTPATLMVDAVVASYTLLSAEMPEMVKALGEMLAVVVKVPDAPKL